MNSLPPIGEGVPSPGPWPSTWSIWFGQVFDCLPWKKGLNVTAKINFGSVPAQDQVASSAIAVKGARPGDAVQVTPSSDMAGVFYTGVVTGKDQVTLYAKNFSASAKVHSLMTFRIIILQN